MNLFFILKYTQSSNEKNDTVLNLLVKNRTLNGRDFRNESCQYIGIIFKRLCFYSWNSQLLGVLFH